MTQSFKTETRRIIDAYARRNLRGQPALYRWWLPDVHISQYRFRTVAARGLVSHGWSDLAARDVLDVGCGVGAWLRTLMEWGADPAKLHGIDILPDRIAAAKRIGPHLDYRVSNGWPLPFADASMDLISANLVFSSIKDPNARLALATEMKRVRRSGGLIFIYDFRISSPRNADTVGIGKREIARLFPGLKSDYASIILAPPIQRLVAPFSALLALGLETLIPPLRTHLMCLLSDR